MYQLKRQGFDILGNTLEIMSPLDTTDCFARLYIKGEEHLQAFTYKTDDHFFYLWDLNNGLPDSAKICDKIYQFDIKGVLPSQTKSSIQMEGVQVNLPKHGLFDTLYLRYQKSYDLEAYYEYFNFLNLTEPLRQSAEIIFKPDLLYDTAKSSVYAVNGNGKLSFIGGEWSEGAITFKTRDLVSYTIATDTIPPKIKKLKSAKGRLRFKLDDDLSGIHSFRAELNGNWLLMNYDGKSRTLWSDPKKEIIGDFELVVKDNAENFSNFKNTY